MRTVFIAEKPSLGRAIAEVIGIKNKRKTHIECKNDTIVTWCFGHILELAKPDEYVSGEKWRLEDLPIIPSEWKKHHVKGTKEQFNVIKSLIAQADVIVNAGDSEREGQLIVDEVLEYIRNKKPVKRIWLQALDEQNIKKALNSLKDNKQYYSYKLSAEARSYADWLVGMNFTRYFTLKANEFISVGRVRTPTLALVVKRDLEIESFKPHEYYVLVADFKKDGKEFTGTFMPSKKLKEAGGFDEEGRLINKALAEKIAGFTKNKDGKVLSYEKKSKTEYPPMPYMLSSLQKMASVKYGLTAKQVLEIAQILYEKKLTTYPRTDCQYIAEEQHQDAKRILQSLKGILGEPMLKETDTSIKHKAFNSKKITAHTAIIPTGDTRALEKLGELETAIYKDIARAYACLFLKPYKYYASNALIDIDGYTFKATGKETIQRGFSQFCASGKAGDNIILPPINKNDTVHNTQTSIVTKHTTPPPRFTDGTLIEAMSHIHRYITEADAKKILKESDGIGTEATRAEIIEQLVKNGYLKRQKKQIISTLLGREIIAQLPDFIKNPVLTASWERGLNGIVTGNVGFDEFMAKQKEFIKKHIKAEYSIEIENGKNNNKNGNGKALGKCSCGGDIVETQKTYKCEDCGKYVFKVVTAKKLTQKQAINLLQGKTIEVKGLKSRKGKKFSARLTLKQDGDKWKTEMSFGG